MLLHYREVHAAPLATFVSSNTSAHDLTPSSHLKTADTVSVSYPYSVTVLKYMFCVKVLNTWPAPGQHVAPPQLYGGGFLYSHQIQGKGGEAWLSLISTRRGSPVGRRPFTGLLHR